MRYIFASVFVTLISVCVSGQTGIYQFKVDSVSGPGKVDFSAFAGKKILIINLGSADSSFFQFGECKQLYQLYKDSLVIVAVPMQDGTAEPGTGTALQNIYVQTGAFRFPVTAKIAVTGPNAHPLFKWLTSASLNGVLDTQIRKPGYKFLIDKNGRLIGVYNPRVSPMNPIIRTAIEMTYNF